MQPRPILLAACFYFMQVASAQTTSPRSDSGAPLHQRNFFKTNLTSIPLKNYSLQYERVLSKAVSIAVTYRTMPTTFIPFKSAVLDAVGDDQDTKDIINQTE